MKTTTNYSAEFGPDVLRHRIILTYEAEAQAVTTDAIINQESFECGSGAVKQIPLISYALCIVSILLCSCSTAPKPFAPAKMLPDEVVMNKEAGRGGHLNVTVSFDGEELPFILDTGAPVTALDKSLEPKLGKSYGTASIRLADGVKQKTGIFAPPKLYLGKTPLMPGDFVCAYDFKGHPMGILGMDYLRHYCVQLDFEAAKIRFLDSNKLRTNELGQCYPITFQNGYPCIKESGLTGDNTNLLIDVGCNIDGATDKGTNQFDGVYLPVCHWNGQDYTDMIVAAASHANLLGLRFLGRHLVTFDFPHQRMFLKQISAGPVDSTSSGDDSESAQKSGIRFLMKLKENGELPGWPKKESQTAVYFQKPQGSDSNSASFRLWKSVDLVAYHYEIVRTTKPSPWKLKRAWCEDANGNLIQELLVP
jgi:hypothetical protein